MPPLRILGAVLAALGVVMAAFPHWFGPLTGGSEPPADTFEAIEKRIRGGMLLGIGLFFLARTELRPWSITIASGLFFFVFGALAVRVGGLIADGNDSRQWMWVAGEALVLAVLGFWLWRGQASG